jgi:hypothetical protein
MRHWLTTCALSAMLVLPAVAQDCPMGESIYGQEETGWALVFLPVPEEYAGGPFTNAFALWVPDSPLSLTGTVNWTNGFAQPWGEIYLECEEGADPASCRVWEGSVYEVRDGTVSYIAAADRPAPEQILLPDLGGSLWYSNLRYVHTIEDMPWDVFTFRECGP